MLRFKVANRAEDVCITSCKEVANSVNESTHVNVYVVFFDTFINSFVNSGSSIFSTIDRNSLYTVL